MEPTYLGFKNPAVDYANLDKLKNAIGSVPWTLSGLGHFFSGFACVVLALTGRQMFRDYQSAAGRLLLGAGFVAGIGFFLTGIRLAGGGAVKLLSAQNPDLERAPISPPASPASSTTAWPRWAWAGSPGSSPGAA